MPRFTYNHLTYEFPPDVDVVVYVDDEHADFNFVKDGEEIPMYGGFDVDGKRVPTWEEAGIRKIEPAGGTIDPVGRA